MRKNIIFILMMALFTAANTVKAQQSFKNIARETSPEFFQSDEAKRVGDQVLLYQRVTGGWPKNIDMAKPLSDEQKLDDERETLFQKFPKNFSE